jgi:hypothetical protein
MKLFTANDFSLPFAPVQFICAASRVFMIAATVAVP